MKVAKIPKVEMKCERCGKPQPKDENKSNENWNVFDCKAVCSCGGKFQMFIDGEMIGGGSDA